MADGQREGSDPVRTIGQLLGLVAGFLGLVYAAGGGVLALRLFLADLPSRTIVSQLPRDVLISVGLAQIVLPVLGIAALYAIYRFLGAATAPPTRLVHGTAPSGRDWAVRVAASAIPALVVAGSIALFADSVRSEEKLWLVALAFLVTLIVVLVALSLRAKLVDRYHDQWNSPRPVALMTLVVALAAVPISVLIAGAFFELLDAKVCTTDSEVTGVLIGETSNRTYIGETRDETPLIVYSIPSAQIEETLIGGEADERLCPARRSG